MKTRPAAATPRPTGAKSNMAKLAPVACSRKLAMMMFGGVPIRVIRPPRSEAKLSGISRRLTGLPLALALMIATGSSRASAPTLFMKAEQTAARPVSTMMCSVGLPLKGRSSRTASSVTADLRRACERMSTAATVTTAGCPKPVKASSAETSPVSTAASRAMTATAS